MSQWADTLAPLLAWIGAHPHWAGLIVALIACAESLALVGLFVPGAVLMFGAGAVIGSGELALAPMVAWAVAGAVVGDGVSFWLGWYYRDRLRGFWPFSRYPGALARGEQFFLRHGGKSVIIGRFVGPVRPIIPAVAGMLGMPAPRFLAANVASALVWAPAYLLPGMVFAASLSLAAEVAGRLVALLLLTGAGLWALIWGARRAERPLRFGGQRIARGVGRRPPAGIPGLLLRPGHAALRGLRHRPGRFWWVALAVLLACVLDVALWPVPADWERAALAMADAYRSLPARDAWWLVTQLGGTLPIVLATLAGSAVLALAGRRHEALSLAAAVALAKLLGYGMKALLAVPRPNGLTATEGFFYAFPSGHATGIAAVVTALLVLGAPAARGRVLAFLAGVLLVLTVAASRVALGVHWPLDVLAGMALGTVVGALPGLLAGRSVPAPLRRRVLTMATVGLLGGAALTALSGWPDPVASYPGESRPPRVEADAWWRGELAMPARRQGLGGREGAFQAAWLGGEAAPAGFAAAGWSAPAPWDWRGALLWLSPRPDALRLPPLPRWHAGRLPEAVLVRPEGPAERRVLRAWVAARTDEGPLWLLQVERERLQAGPLFLSVEAVADTSEPGTTLADLAARTGYDGREGEIARYRPSEN
ncbi:phosphatase PAP2 family protein [Spiribacter halobius]|uniref:Phosphatidic acid phosphatase type 2/haloperoxidase domain-containing protein n=1 Tax=Sediminicurvatus halobius TaxID=2182432 RepID=A0A2U2MZZ6_9GAMM|nr:phosphatase PAP2 family protein [Spiribacter halobius]PWG62506.1 hypothetical protein DEM34_12040 [Spiribacter halobius]UEX78600.1 phosphatase PAP2 family protein [Spiribacter halobius]